MMSIHVTIQENNTRIDRFLALHYPEYTRTFLKKLILSGKIRQNGSLITKASAVVHVNDVITVENFELPPRMVDTSDLPPFCNSYLLYEHEHFLVVQKPAGLMTHQPAHHSEEASLADILAAQRPEIASVGQEGRKGIVHRLDRDTSGLLIVAKTQYGYETFIELFKNRQVKKTYLALVKGHPPAEGTITTPLKRHPVDPRKIVAGNSDDRAAHTDFKTITLFEDYALIEAYPLTGRTHQIRVHMASFGYPVLGDSLYGTASKLIKRQALHAQKLEFTFDGEKFTFECPLPDDMQRLIL